MQHFFRPAAWLMLALALSQNASLYAQSDVTGATSVEIEQARSQPKLLWQFATQGPLWSDPVTDGESFWFGSDDGHLYALDVASGEQRWKFATQNRVRGQAALGEKNIYFTADDGKLYALDKATGKLNYQVSLGSEDIPRQAPAYEQDNRFDWRGSSPLLSDGQLYVGSADGKVRALKAETGAQIWEFQTEGSVRSRPALIGETLIVGSWDGKVYGLHSASGKEQWRYDTGGAVHSDVSTWKGLAIIGSRSAALYALEGGTGKLAWEYRHQSGSWVESSATVEGDRIYIGSSDALRLFSLEAASGRQLWEFETGGWAWATPAVQANQVFIGALGVSPHWRDSMLQGLFAVNAETGKPNWFLPSKTTEGYVTGGVASRPLAVDGRLLVTDLDGVVRAFDVPASKSE